MLNYSEIEEKWQKAWKDAGIFESDVSGGKPYLVTAAFPYPNSPLHIGHMRTYGTADALARYKRMCGYNVLYPMAFHATGTPVLAFAKRIASKDEDLIREMRDLFHIPLTDIEKMTDPLFIANYFIGELERGMKYAGFGIDWRRKFVSIDPQFSKFVEWQFGLLNNRGYLKKGKHPVGWCPNENNAVGMHDTRRDVEPEIEKITAIKFNAKRLGAYVVCATFRPETVYGATNLFVNETAKYVICRINDDGEQYVISKAAGEELRFQMKIETVREIEGKELLSELCTNPATGVDIPILPGFFVEEGRGTGVVMSVPAHAPFDFVALERLRKVGYDVHGIEPIKVIEVEVGRSLDKKHAGHETTGNKVPAFAYLAMFDADQNSKDDLIEMATKLQYKEESRWGKMILGGCEGMGEKEAREKTREMLSDKMASFEMYILMNESKVLCRCGYGIVVKIVDDQWFINYGDKEWKNEAREALSGIRVLPEGSRNAFSSALEWIDMRAVVRSQGLGTRFPLDKSRIIESLSDSTLYMSFYTISNTIRDIDPARLSSGFFDYVFLGKGSAEEVARSTGIDFQVVQRCRDSFDYWYVDTSRHSGPDLIYNHLVMYIFNHVAVFDKKRWPRQIVVNGFVLSEGEKMSKSIGNITPLIDGIAAFGADPLRAVVVAGADLINDSDYASEAIRGVKERFDYLHDLCKNLGSYEAGEIMQIDYWLYSKLNSKIQETTRNMENMELRSALTNLLYGSVLELKRYLARGGRNGIVMKDYLSAVALMLQPVVPHVSEEFWHILGNTAFASAERWPAADSSMINEKIERGEELIDKVVADAKEIAGLISKKNEKKADKIRVIVAADWKRELDNVLASTRDLSKAMKHAKGMKGVEMEKASRYLAATSRKAEFMHETTMNQDDEFRAYLEASEYIGSLLNANVVVEREDESKSQRADRARPLKPSIDLS